MKRNRIRNSAEDRVFSFIAYTLATLALIITLYPLLYCISASFSDPMEVVKGNVILLPKNPRLWLIRQWQRTNPCSRAMSTLFFIPCLAHPST